MLVLEPLCCVSVDGSTVLACPQVLSASLDGTLRQWDIQEGVVRRTWTFGGPIESMVSSSQQSAGIGSSVPAGSRTNDFKQLGWLGG